MLLSGQTLVDLPSMGKVQVHMKLVECFMSSALDKMPQRGNSEKTLHGAEVGLKTGCIMVIFNGINHKILYKMFNACTSDTTINLMKSIV